LTPLVPSGRLLVTPEEISLAADRLAGVLRATPAAPSSSLSEIAGRKVYAKPEHFQRTGSFKIRGAYNKISAVAATGGVDEVVAASAGNHAQGVALAASLCGLRSVVFMPEGASLPKVEATRRYGAEVRFQAGSVDDAISAAKEYSQKSGACYVPPFDDPLVISGQATVGTEIASEVPDAGVVVVPVGGGGLIAGVAAGLRAAGSSARVVGVEAAGAQAMRAALGQGGPVTLGAVETMADGIAVRCVSPLTLSHVEALVERVVTVDEEAISRAVLLLLERCKWVVEPAGAVPLAALLSGVVPGNDPAVLVLSGGNVDPLLLTRIVEHGLGAAGRYLRVRVVLADRPGALAALATVVGELGLNLLSVEHRRSGTAVGVREVEVELTLETRDPAHRDAVAPALRSHGFHLEP
jgi:threonine dehydratase